MTVIPPGISLDFLGISPAVGLTIFIVAQALLGIKFIKPRNIEGKFGSNGKEGKKKSFLPPAAKK